MLSIRSIQIFPPLEFDMILTNHTPSPTTIQNHFVLHQDISHTLLKYKIILLSTMEKGWPIIIKKVQYKETPFCHPFHHMVCPFPNNNNNGGRTSMTVLFQITQGQNHIIVRNTWLLKSPTPFYHQMCPLNLYIIISFSCISRNNYSLAQLLQVFFFWGYGSSLFCY